MRIYIYMYMYIYIYIYTYVDVYIEMAHLGTRGAHAGDARDAGEVKNFP